MRKRKIDLADQDVLDAVAALDKAGKVVYGLTLRLQLSQRLGYEVSYGKLYWKLATLEVGGLLKSSYGEATPQRGGRRKRVFQLVQPGRGV